MATSRGRLKPPPPTLVLFVRHALTPTTGAVLPGRAAGLHLSEEGRAQAEALASRIGAFAAACSDGSRPQSRKLPKVAAVYSSPLERARETAAPIAAALGLAVKAAAGLLECDFGEWTGAPLKELSKRPEWHSVQRYPSGFRFPGGESFAGMQARMLETVSELRARHAGEAVVAVSHADPIKAAVAEALGTHLDLFQRIVVSPCSVTAVSYGPDGPTVLAVNSTGSLRELAPA